MLPVPKIVGDVWTLLRTAFTTSMYHGFFWIPDGTMYVVTTEMAQRRFPKISFTAPTQIHGLHWVCYVCFHERIDDDFAATVCPGGPPPLRYIFCVDICVMPSKNAHIVTAANRRNSVYVGIQRVMQLRGARCEAVKLAFAQTTHVGTNSYVEWTFRRLFVVIAQAARGFHYHGMTNNCGHFAQRLASNLAAYGRGRAAASHNISGGLSVVASSSERRGWKEEDLRRVLVRIVRDFELRGFISFAPSRQLATAEMDLRLQAATATYAPSASVGVSMEDDVSVYPAASDPGLDDADTVDEQWEGVCRNGGAAVVMCTDDVNDTSDDDAASDGTDDNKAWRAEVAEASAVAADDDDDGFRSVRSTWTNSCDAARRNDSEEYSERCPNGHPVDESVSEIDKVTGLLLRRFICRVCEPPPRQANLGDRPQAALRHTPSPHDAAATSGGCDDSHVAARTPDPEDHYDGCDHDPAFRSCLSTA